MSIIFRHYSLSAQCEVSHGVCPVLGRHDQVFMLAMDTRRAEVIELEVREAEAPLVKALPFDISIFTNTAPQECGILQFVIDYIKNAGILCLALGLLPLRWWGVINKARSLDGIVWCVRRGLHNFFPNISALKSVVYHGAF